MYLTLLDEKGVLPVIFRSKRSKDDGRGGKFTQSRFTPPRPLICTYSIRLRYACKSNVVECARIECKCIKRFRLTSKGQVGYQEDHRDKFWTLHNHPTRPNQNPTRTDLTLFQKRSDVIYAGTIYYGPTAQWYLSQRPNTPQMQCSV